MSRSNPTVNAPHPCTKWFEWDGAEGGITYWDKDQKIRVEMPKDFTFIVLDRLGVVKGYHDRSKSGITSNEVRDSTKDPFVVRAFQGGEIARGLWKEIKTTVDAAGGGYAASIYLAYKNGDGKLAIGNIYFRGAALNAWVEFENKNRESIYKKAIQVVGMDKLKKGKVEYVVPKFAVRDISPESNAQAVELDKALQAHLAEYFKKRTTEQTPTPAPTQPPVDEPRGEPANDDPHEAPEAASKGDYPF